jgi:hypothetical protein
MFMNRQYFVTADCKMQVSALITVFISTALSLGIVKDTFRFKCIEINVIISGEPVTLITDCMAIAD